MQLPDVNVLLYAFRADAPKHPECKAWLESLLNGEAAYGISPQVLSSVIRIATHPKIYKEPSPLLEVVAFCELLMAQPHCQTVNPGSRHWPIFRRLLAESKAAGNLVPDAWFAAIAIEHGCEWVTADSDYGSFGGLKWRGILRE